MFAVILYAASRQPEEFEVLRASQPLILKSMRSGGAQQHAAEVARLGSQFLWRVDKMVSCCSGLSCCTHDSPVRVRVLISLFVYGSGEPGGLQPAADGHLNDSDGC